MSERGGAAVREPRTRPSASRSPGRQSRSERHGRQDLRPRREPLREVQPSNEPLPIAAVAQDLMEAITTHDTVVLRAGTGSGKSTLAPVIFLEALQKANPQKKVKMIVAEPRQFLVEKISDRVAKLHNVPLGGDLVGFYHGDDQNYSKDNTQIVYTVSGSLRKRIEEDKSLEAYDAVVLDEIHLLDKDQYAILIGLKEVQKERARKGMTPLKIILVSASVEQKYGDYYGNAIVKEVKGEESKYKVEKKEFATKRIDQESIPIEMARLAARVIKDQKNYGDVVGFLPGRHEIQMAIDEFNRIMQEEGLAEKYKCGAFTGGGGAENKAIEVILASDDKTRDPIAAFVTDVGEAGATFGRLTKVIDSGKARTNVYDEETGLESLQTRNHAYANYVQRLGRLARTENGEFYALYPEEDLLDESIHPREAPPSVIKEDLTPLLLSLKRMGIVDAYDVDYPDHPGKEKIDQAVEKLNLLGALHPDGTLTEEGEAMAELPYDLHFARMLVEAKKRGCLEPVSVLVGFLNSKKSVFAFDRRREQFDEKYAQYTYPGSDFITLLKVWNAKVGTSAEEKATWEKERGKFNESVLSDVQVTKNEVIGEAMFKDLGLDRNNKVFNLKDETLLANIQKSIAAGLADWLLNCNPNGSYKLANGKRDGIAVGYSSVMARNPSLAIVSGKILLLDTGQAFATFNQEVKEEWRLEIAPQLGPAEAASRAQRERNSASENAASLASAALVENTSAVQVTAATAAVDNNVSQAKEPTGIKAFFKRAGKAIETFINAVKQAAAAFFDRLKKWLRIK